MKQQLLTILLFFSFTTCFCQKEDSLQNAQGTFYALLIAQNAYQDEGITDLQYSIQNADSLADVLTRLYTFEKENVFVLKDASKTQILKKMVELANRLTENDNLLIFYAGHGIEKNNVGFWLPSDAEKNDFVTWLSSDELISIIKHIKAKHILLVIDAYVGYSSLTRCMCEHADLDPYILGAKQSRTWIISDTSEEVPDQSVFIKYFLKALKNQPAPCIGECRLLNSFKNNVTANSPTMQKPQKFSITNVGHEGGSFIFYKK